MHECKIHLAHQAIMLNDANQLLAINRQQIRAHGRMVADLPQLNEDAMGIHIGDVNFQPQPTSLQFGGLSSLVKALLAGGIGAGLLATGGIGVMSLASLLRPAASAAPPAMPIDIEIPWQWKDGKMQFGSPRQSDADVTLPIKRW